MEDNKTWVLLTEHLQDVKDELDEYDNPEKKDLDTLIEELDNIEFSHDMDMAYIMGRIRAIQYALTIIESEGK